MQVQEINNKQAWEDFLLGCREKTFLQSWGWGEFNSKMQRKSWYFMVYDGDKPVACFLTSKIGAKRGIFLFVPHGPVTIEGLSFEQKKEVIKLILEKLKEIAKTEKAVFIRISPIWLRNSENISVFKELGFRAAPVHMHPETSWELNISGSEEDILKQMRKTTRYLVRQAEKNADIEIVKSQDAKDLEQFNFVYSETGKRQHFRIYNSKYIETEFESFLKNDQIMLFLGKYKGEVAVAAMFVFWQNACYYHHSGSLSEYNKYPISYLLQWEAMKEAKKRGCQIYNFWGIAPDIKSEGDVKKSKHPWAGLSFFKMGFGGYRKDLVIAQDFILSQKYWINYIIETIRKIKRGL